MYSPCFVIRDFFSILGRGPRAFQIGKICAANPKIGILVIVHIYVVLAITHIIAIKVHVAFV